MTRIYTKTVRHKTTVIDLYKCTNCGHSADLHTTEKGCRVESLVDGKRCSCKNFKRTGRA